jgi:hypothetical protein
MTKKFNEFFQLSEIYEEDIFENLEKSYFLKLIPVLKYNGWIPLNTKCKQSYYI